MTASLPSPRNHPSPFAPCSTTQATCLAQHNQTRHSTAQQNQHCWHSTLAVRDEKPLSSQNVPAACYLPSKKRMYHSATATTTNVSSLGEAVLAPSPRTRIRTEVCTHACGCKHAVRPVVCDQSMTAPPMSRCFANALKDCESYCRSNAPLCA